MIAYLTKDEIEIVRHRLGVSDAIADALEDEYERDIIESTVDALRLIANADNQLNNLETAIVTDCLDGSTFFANSSEWKSIEKARWSKAALSLESKFNVEIPRA